VDDRLDGVSAVIRSLHVDSKFECVHQFASLFERLYPKGPFKVPPSGKVNNPLFGEFSGTVDKTLVSFGTKELTLSLTLAEYPGVVLEVPRKVALAAGLYRPKSDTVEDAKGWKVRVRCQEPTSKCAVVSLTVTR
jgi:hypothetical protein